MYNEEVKSKWLSELQKNRAVTAAFLFEVSEPFEVSANTDIAEMPPEDVTDIFSRWGISNYRTLVSNIAVFKSYAVWYSKNIKPIPIHNITAVKADNVDVSDAIRSTFIKTERDLVDFGRFRKPEDGEPFVPVQFLLWHGFDLHQIFDMRSQDVTIDGEAVTVTVDDKRKVFVSPLAVDAINKYSATQVKYLEHVSGYREAYSDTGYFIKTFRGVASEGKRTTFGTFRVGMAANYAEIREENKSYTPHSIMESGRFNRAYMREIQGLELPNEWWETEFRVSNNPIRGRTISLLKKRFEVYKKVFWS